MSNGGPCRRLGRRGPHSCGDGNPKLEGPRHCGAAQNRNHIPLEAVPKAICSLWATGAENLEYKRERGAPKYNRGCICGARGAQNSIGVAFFGPARPQTVTRNLVRSPGGHLQSVGNGGRKFRASGRKGPHSSGAVHPKPAGRAAQLRGRASPKSHTLERSPGGHRQSRDNGGRKFRG